MPNIRLPFLTSLVVSENLICENRKSRSSICPLSMVPSPTMPFTNSPDGLWSIRAKASPLWASRSAPVERRGRTAEQRTAVGKRKTDVAPRIPVARADFETEVRRPPLGRQLRPARRAARHVGHGAGIGQTEDAIGHLIGVEERRIGIDQRLRQLVRRDVRPLRLIESRRSAIADRHADCRRLRSVTALTVVASTVRRKRCSLMRDTNISFRGRVKFASNCF